MTENVMKRSTGANRATNAKIELRVQAIAKLMRGGTSPSDLRQFVAEKELAGEEPWKLGPGCGPLSSRTIERYAARATKRIRDELRKEEREIVRRLAAERKKKHQEDRIRYGF